MRKRMLAKSNLEVSAIVLGIFAFLVFHGAFSEAISMEKRYFTSDLDMRS
jgi:hypothetical protein